MARNRFLGRAFPQRSARLTQWLGPADQGFVSVAATGSSLVATAPFTEPATLMRTRGAVSIIPDSTAADVSIVGAIGMAIVSTDAVGIGITAIPTPYADADWGGWFVWRSFAFRFESITQVGVLLGSWSLEIDSKAMRKITPNETMVIVAESQGGAFAITDGTRHLIKLT